MKKTVTFILMTITVTAVSAQISRYNYNCGKESSKIIWEENRRDNLIHLSTTQGSEKQKYTLRDNYQTIYWEYSNFEENTQIKVELKNGIYHVKGIIKSKPYTKTHKSAGKPWYQHIGFALGYLMDNRSSIIFECIRPDNLKLYEMQADAKEYKTNGNAKEQRINIHLTGFLAKYFGSDYYINPDNKKFIRYEGVHGAPGTPKTVITLEK